MSWLSRLFGRHDAPPPDPWQARIDALSADTIPPLIRALDGEPEAVRRDVLRRARIAIGDAPDLLSALARARPADAAAIWTGLIARPEYALEAHEALADLVDDAHAARRHRQHAAALAPRDVARVRRCLDGRPTRVPPQRALGAWPPLVDRLPARFTPRAPLGTGPHGHVVRVVADTAFAAKALRTDLHAHPALDRVFADLQRAQTLDLPGLATITHLDRAAGCWVRTLGVAALGGRPGVDLAPVRAAVAALHAAGLAHGAVKPANIIIDARGAPRLTDLGLCRLDGVEPDPAADRAALARLEDAA